jgi:hypothetical protein
MGSVLIQPGLATAVMHFTADLALLLAGLVGVVWLSAAMISLVALRHLLAPCFFSRRVSGL